MKSKNQEIISFAKTCVDKFQRKSYYCQKVSQKNVRIQLTGPGKFIEYSEIVGNL